MRLELVVPSEDEEEEEEEGPAELQLLWAAATLVVHCTLEAPLCAPVEEEEGPYSDFGAAEGPSWQHRLVMAVEDAPEVVALEEVMGLEAAPEVMALEQALEVGVISSAPVVLPVAEEIGPGRVFSSAAVTEALEVMGLEVGVISSAVGQR